MLSFDVDILVTFDQVKQFGLLTGDNGPIHSELGIVQGGLILSMLPNWLGQIECDSEPDTGNTFSVSAMHTAKFKNKLPSDTWVKINFSHNGLNKRATKIFWRIYDDQIDYCAGEWLVCKTSFDKQ